jgi:nucleotide-binding universal stress UspA family protein
MTAIIRHILVPTDFGRSSQATAAYAAALAKSLDTSVHLVHVLEQPVVARGWHAPDTQALDRRYHDCRARLAAFAASLQRPADRISIEVRFGRPVEAIVEAAIDYGADLIVMSTPARGGLPHLMRESVADRVVREARCPVLAVRGSGAARVHPAPHAA